MSPTEGPDAGSSSSLQSECYLTHVTNERASQADGGPAEPAAGTKPSP